jgi:hypothetical protein
MATATELRESTVLHVGGLHYASEPVTALSPPCGLAAVAPVPLQCVARSFSRRAS